MNVRWMLPDGTAMENAVPDVEQLLMLLRLVNGVTLDRISYQIADTRLVVDGKRLHVLVSLASPPPKR